MKIINIEYWENINGKRLGSFGIYKEKIEIDSLQKKPEEWRELAIKIFGEGRPKIDTKLVKCFVFCDNKKLFEGFINNPIFDN